MTVDEAEALLNEIDEDGHGLTDWEADFIDDMLKQIDVWREPTERQAEIIRKIHRERVD